MNFKIFDRKLFIWLVFSFMLAILLFRLSQLTLVEGEELSKRAMDIRLKKITIPAKRGEIYDRKGKLLAGNLTSYGVNFLYNKKYNEEQQKMAIELFSLLENDGEIVIEMPIVFQDGEFIYRSDLEKKEWLERNGFSSDFSAKEVLTAYREREHIAPEIDKYTAFDILVAKGIYLPIRLKEMEFNVDFQRSSFLQMYGIDENASAREAIDTLSEREKLSKEYTDKERYYVLLLKNAINIKGFLKYEPIEIAEGISKKNAIYIEEHSMQFPNVSVTIEPVRYYPTKNLAAHILGYLGEISTSREQEIYNEEAGYRKTDLIGKRGLEGAYESELKGESGSKYIEVNNEGGYVGDVGGLISDPAFSDKDAVGGKNIVTTIDIDLQAKVKEYLIKNLEALRTAGTYHSEFGDTHYKRAYPYANTGSVVVQDVTNGEILAMVSYPDYDNNLFARGISYDDYKTLLPENKRNPLAPRPLYNIATQTAVQPGSTFKMVTGFAALTAGLDPYSYYNGAGHIVTDDGQSFGCWLWNKYYGSHGYINLMKAIEVSCNYYFYSVGNGFDYASGRKMPFDVGSEKIIEAAKLFGLDEPSGVEIGETAVGVPNPNRKKDLLLALMRKMLINSAEEYFNEEIYSDDDQLETAVENIVNSCAENPQMSYNDVHTLLVDSDFFPDDDKLWKLTETIKFDYLSQFGWFEGDTFNLAIGQGQHSYTPVQMARYVSTVANGGYLYKSTLVKTIDGKPAKREPYKFIDPNGYIKYLRQGMRQVVSGSQGSAKFYFNGFPIPVAAKTGTAEREGKIQPPDEEKYILKYLDYIAPNIAEAELQIKTDELLFERTNYVASLFEQVNGDDKAKAKAAKLEIDNLIARHYLTRGEAMRAALVELSVNSLTSEQIDQYKDEFDNFTWFVSFAPYENPEIAVAVLIPQGGSGGYGAAIVKDIYGYYFGLTKK